MIPDRYAAYEKVVTLGACNLRVDAGDKAGNLERIEANLREAAAQGIDIDPYRTQLERFAETGALCPIA